MNVKLLNGTENPENEVCRAARNDYRPDGVIGHSFEKVLGGGSIDGWAIDEVVNERGIDIEPAETSRLTDLPDDVELEARKRTLIAHLMDSGHWGPFEHPQAVVAIEGVTRVLTHQLVRHRHFSYDQQSLRYVEVENVEDVFEQFQLPKFRGEDFDVDREGVHELRDPDRVEKLYRDAYQDASAYYQMLLDQGVPREQARKVLPMGTKTNIVMSGNARAWMHILHVRTRADVQGETRRCAEAIFDELREWMPYTFDRYDEMLDTKLKNLAP